MRKAKRQTARSREQQSNSLSEGISEGILKKVVGKMNRRHQGEDNFKSASDAEEETQGVCSPGVNALQPTKFPAAGNFAGNFEKNFAPAAADPMEFPVFSRSYRFPAGRICATQGIFREFLKSGSSGRSEA